MELVLFEEVDVQRARGKNLAYLRKEICVFEFAVGVDVHDGDVVLYCYGSRALGMERGVGLRSWRDEGAGALRCEDVLDADWDRWETLLYCEVVEYLGAVKSNVRLADAVKEKVQCVRKLIGFSRVYRW